MRNEVMWAIRDARGLTQNEKALLWAIESRGTAIAKWDTLAADAGMSKDRFYRARHSLCAKGLITVSRRHNGVSSYEVDADSLYANEWVTDSHSANEDSHSANTDSHMTETKKNIKKNKKKNSTTKKNSNGASATEDTPLKGEDVPTSILNLTPSFEEVVSPLMEDARFSLKKTSDADSHYANEEYESRTPADWLQIRKTRPLTQDEKDFINERSSAYMAEQRAKQEAEESVEAW